MALQNSSKEKSVTHFYSTIHTYAAADNYTKVWDNIIELSILHEDKPNNDAIKLSTNFIIKIFKLLDVEHNNPTNKNTLTGVLNYIEKSSKSEEINNLISEYSSHILYSTIVENNNSLIEAIKPFLNKKNTKIFKSVDLLVRNNNIDSLLQFVDIGVNILKEKQNSSFLLNCFDKGIYDLKFYECLINQYDFDFNRPTESYKIQKMATEKINFFQTLFLSNHLNGKKLFKDFTNSFIDNIDFDINIQENTGYSETTDFFKYLQNITRINIDKENISNNIISNLEFLINKNCFSEKHIAKISSIIFQPEIINKFYDHTIYDSFFKNPILKSNNFNTSDIVRDILKADHSSQIVKNILHEKGTNPTIVLLNSFLSYNKNNKFSPSHPFLYWGSIETVTTDSTFEYMFNLYENDIKQFSENQLKPLFSPIKKKLVKLGIDKAKPTGLFTFFHNLYSPKKIEIQPVSIEKNEDYLIQTIEDSTILLNNNLKEQIKEPEVLTLVNAIQNNIDTYNLSEDYDLNAKHFMLTTLPNLINKSIVNYLEMKSIDIDITTDALTTQLKLLNNKTFAILKNVLEDKENQLNVDQRVTTKLIRKH